MTRISNVDQALLLLREQLRRMDKGRDTARPSRGAKASPATADPLRRIQALAALDTLDDEELGRALVQNLLVDHFGESLANDSRFQTMVRDVTQLIESDAESRAMLGAAVRRLRG